MLAKNQVLLVRPSGHTPILLAPSNSFLTLHLYLFDLAADFLKAFYPNIHGSILE